MRVDRDEASTPPSSSMVPSPRLSAPFDTATGLVQEVGWPDRTVAVLSDAPQDALMSVVQANGFVPVRISPAHAGTVVGSLDPFTFLFVDADSFELESTAGLVEHLWQRSPSARGILLFTDQTRPRSLVGAVRAGLVEVADREDRDALQHVFGSQLQRAGEGRERVLAIGAHPDDIEIGCAGTLLGHRHRGDRISLLTLSQGAVGGLSDVRRQESVSTALAIGGQLLLGDLEDTRIAESVGTIRTIEAVVERLRPTVVYVHSTHDTHQDHRAVHTAAMSATRRVPSVFAYQSPSATDDFRPTKFVPIDQMMTGKVDVLGLFESQRERTYMEPEMVIANARYWARHLAPLARYAEPFEVIRSTDPSRGPMLTTTTTSTVGSADAATRSEGVLA